jgi:hypothetical protein
MKKECDECNLKSNHCTMLQKQYISPLSFQDEYEISKNSCCLDSKKQGNAWQKCQYYWGEGGLEINRERRTDTVGQASVIDLSS